MNRNIRDRWIRELRSGKYKQTRERLRIGDRYCCLGVLCNIYSEERRAGSWDKLEEWRGPREFSRYQKGEFEFIDELGFKERTKITPHMRIWSGLSKEMNNELTNKNDREQLDFNEIADFIENEL